MFSLNNSERGGGEMSWIPQWEKDRNKWFKT